MKANNEALFEVIQTFPDDELDTRITLPFGGGMVVVASPLRHRASDIMAGFRHSIVGGPQQ
jgi:hypothetical protein